MLFCPHERVLDCDPWLLDVAERWGDCEGVFGGQRGSEFVGEGKQDGVHQEEELGLGCTVVVYGWAMMG